jgi:hypothetical protein
MRLALAIVGFLGLFGCKPKVVTSNAFAFNLKLVLDTAVRLEEVSIGNLFLPTGRIVAGDPFFINTSRPFKTKVNPGNYPVKLLIYKIEEDHYRVAYARIQFSDSRATHWRLAVTESMTDQESKGHQEGGFFGYAVDSGLGCFTDLETTKIFESVKNKFYRDNPDKNYFGDVLAKEFEASSGQHPLSIKTGDWNNHFPHAGDNHNVIMFSSGWGDGAYPTYWGMSQGGEIVELITDFIVIGGE